jgi:hypothetical protein
MNVQAQDNTLHSYLNLERSSESYKLLEGELLSFGDGSRAVAQTQLFEIEIVETGF